VSHNSIASFPPAIFSDIHLQPPLSSSSSTSIHPQISRPFHSLTHFLISNNQLRHLPDEVLDWFSILLPSMTYDVISDWHCCVVEVSRFGREWPHWSATIAFPFIATGIFEVLFFFGVCLSLTSIFRLTSKQMTVVPNGLPDSLKNLSVFRMDIDEREEVRDASRLKEYFNSHGIHISVLGVWITRSSAPFVTELPNLFSFSCSYLSSAPLRIALSCRYASEQLSKFVCVCVCVCLSEMSLGCPTLLGESYFLQTHQKIWSVGHLCRLNQY
jgi:hypothetical protein